MNCGRGRLWADCVTGHGRGMTAVSEVRATADQVRALADFATHLRLQRGLSDHTVRAYLSDLEHLLAYAGRQGYDDLADIDLGVLRGWLASMAAAQRSRSTLARRGAAARTFFEWASRTGRVPADPALRLASARAAQHLPTVLAVDSAARLLDVARTRADDADPVHLRDWAALELLYATGARVGEICGLDIDDVDLDERTVRVLGKGDKERVVPFGIPAADALGHWASPCSRPRTRAPRCSWAAAADGWTSANCARPPMRSPGSPASTTSPRTPSGTARRPTCSRADQTCAVCRRCWATRAWRPPRGTRT